MTLTLDPASARRRRDDVAGKALSLSIPDCQTLDDHGLLALILGRSHGNPDQLAGDLLARFGSLAAVAAADPSELTRRFQMGAAALSDLKVLRELAVRLVRVEACRRPVITSWTALQAYVRAAMAHLPREQFRVLYLDRRNILLRDEWIAEGTVDHAPVYPREVVRRALELSASALILVHNHPSGDPTPSQAISPSPVRSSTARGCSAWTSTTTSSSDERTPPVSAPSA